MTVPVLLAASLGGGGGREQGQRAEALVLTGLPFCPFLHTAAPPVNSDGGVTPSLCKDGGALLSWNLWIGFSEALEGRPPVPL